MRYLTIDSKTKEVIAYAETFLETGVELGSHQFLAPPEINNGNAFDYFYSEKENEFKIKKPKPGALYQFDPNSEDWVFDDTAAWETVRQRRQIALRDSDWIELPSAKERFGEQLYQAWMDYRQALRDITKQPDPLNIVFPVKPGQEK